LFLKRLLGNGTREPIMTKFKPILLAAGALAVAITLSPLAAEARGGRGGGSDYGDSWINDEIKNPRYIEPYAWADPTRYRAYHHTKAMTSACAPPTSAGAAASTSSRSDTTARLLCRPGIAGPRLTWLCRGNPAPTQHLS
jgi:hypothetical protein